MKFSAYIMLMFCIGLVLYLFGFRGAGLMGTGALTEGQPLTMSSIIQDAISSIFSPNGSGLLMLVTSLVAGIITSMLAGFSAMYIVPFAMLIFALNYFVLPTSFMFNPTCLGVCATLIPDVIKIPLFIFLNVLMVLAILDFARGGA